MYLEFAAPWAMQVIQSKLLLNFPRLDRYMLIPHFIRGDLCWEVDKVAQFFFPTFVTDFILLAVGYSYRYDPSGTNNPGWTGVFGR